jgi:sulfur carrier protein
MKIIVNGQLRDLPSGETLALLAKRFCKDPQHVLAELNGGIVDRQSWDKTRLSEGDKLELVSFVGGG